MAQDIGLNKIEKTGYGLGKCEDGIQRARDAYAEKIEEMRAYCPRTANDPVYRSLIALSIIESDLKNEPAIIRISYLKG